MPQEPIARGIVLLAPMDAKGPLLQLAKEAASILRAVQAPSDVDLDKADYVLVVASQGASLPDLPELKDRAASAIAVAEDEAEGRVTLHATRKRLRTAGATLGHRELVFLPEQFGHLGLESDSARERLEILLRALALDAERLRLKREGWEDP